MNLQLTFENVNPDDIDLHELRTSLASVLGISPDDIHEFQIVPLTSNGKTNIICSLAAVENVEETLNQPDFNIYVSLADTPIAASLGLAKSGHTGNTYLWAFFD